MHDKNREEKGEVRVGSMKSDDGLDALMNKNDDPGIEDGVVNLDNMQLPRRGGEKGKDKMDMPLLVIHSL